MRFSKDGRYLATGEFDGLLRIWDVVVDGSAGASPTSLPEYSGSPLRSALRHAGKSSTSDSLFSKTSLMHSLGAASRSAKTPVPDSSPTKSLLQNESILSHYPSRTFAGHSGPILDVAWSRRLFLLSASTDRTVRLWHPSRNECLAVFMHKDSVSSVKFHPFDERYFLSGDSRLRLWSIAEKKVDQWVDVPGALPPIIGVAFSRDATFSIAATADGKLLFYETNQLRYNTTVEIRAAARTVKGPRILGVETMPAGSAGDDKLLVSAGDGTVRLFNMRDKSLIRAFRGPDFRSGFPFKATFSDDGKYIICGGDNRRVYVWNANPIESRTGRAPRAGSRRPATADRSERGRT
ncbi:WD40-repeat-containing domain protein, partial [Zopfochytrium polystomum]